MVSKTHSSLQYSQVSHKGKRLFLVHHHRIAHSTVCPRYHHHNNCHHLPLFDIHCYRFDTLDCSLVRPLCDGVAIIARFLFFLNNIVTAKKPGDVFQLTTIGAGLTSYLAVRASNKNWDGLGRIAHQLDCHRYHRHKGGSDPGLFHTVEDKLRKRSRRNHSLGRARHRDRNFQKASCTSPSPQTCKTPVTISHSSLQISQELTPVGTKFIDGVSIVTAFRGK